MAKIPKRANAKLLRLPDLSLTSDAYVEHSAAYEWLLEKPTLFNMDNSIGEINKPKSRIRHVLQSLSLLPFA